MRAAKSSVALGLLAAVANAAPLKASDLKRQDAGKLVAAHFMIGIMANRESAADYDSDMQMAKAAGIDAFALNIAKDSYTDAQLNYAYESAAKNDMKVFISFDYNYFATGENDQVGAKLKEYCAKPGQLMVDGKCFASTFNGDTDASKLFNAKTIRDTAGTPLYLVPNLSPTGIRDVSSVDDIDGSFNWIGWDSNGANRAPTAGTNVTTSDFDKKYVDWLGGKTYMAPVSPWFFTNFASKAWNFPGDLLWFRRWNEILALAPKMIEIITWNDYGESHYIGPDSDTSKHSDDGSSAWANGFPHGGWLEMAKPYIAAYKAGKTEVSIDEEKLVYWYRPSPKAACGTFDGIDTLQDAVFVVAMLKEAGKVTVTSGANSQTFDAPAGASAYHVAMGSGKPSFSLARNDAEVFKGEGGLAISDACSPVNLNAFVGVAKGTAQSDNLPAGTPTPSSNTTAPPVGAATQSPVPSSEEPSQTEDEEGAAACASWRSQSRMGMPIAPPPYDCSKYPDDKSTILPIGPLPPLDRDDSVEHNTTLPAEPVATPEPGTDAQTDDAGAAACASWQSKAKMGMPVVPPPYDCSQYSDSHVPGKAFPQKDLDHDFDTTIPVREKPIDAPSPTDAAIPWDQLSPAGKEAATCLKLAPKQDQAITAPMAPPPYDCAKYWNTNDADADIPKPTTRVLPKHGPPMPKPTPTLPEIDDEFTPPKGGYHDPALLSSSSTASGITGPVTPGAKPPVEGTPAVSAPGGTFTLTATAVGPH